jgi:PhnB protein
MAPNHEIETEIFPRLVIERVDEAIAFYQGVFLATLLDRFVDANGVVVHAAVQIGKSIVTMAEEMKAWKLLGPRSIGGSPVLLYLTLPDPDAACSRMLERGSEIIIPIEDRPYGKREGRVRDPFGHLWVLSRATESLSRDEIQRRLATPRH